MKHRFCEVCGEDEKLHSLKKIKFYLPKTYKIQSEYQVVCCDTCGFCYADTLSTIEDYDDYYSNYNFYSTAIVDTSLNKLSEEKRLEEFVTLFDKEDKICDVGFGRAQFLVNLKGRGFKSLYGVDPSTESVRYAAERGISAQEGTVYKLKEVLHEKMNVIILTGVLEHLIQPSLALKNLADCLEYNGHLVVGVPNCGNLKFDNTPLANNFNQEHINYFSRISLINMMRMNGFVEEKIIEDKTYVDMFAIFKYVARQGQCSNQVDNITKNAIQEYISRQEREIQGYNQKISPYMKENKKVLVWGTGAFAMSLISNSELGKCDIRGFVDNNPLKNGTYMYEKEVVLPAFISRFGNVDAIIVCCIKNSENIRMQIKEIGWAGDVVVL
ncbi:MAG: class I SAM-dependent methyltransferase [Oscillospiraceae bacterium]